MQRPILLAALLPDERRLRAALAVALAAAAGLAGCAEPDAPAPDAVNATRTPLVPEPDPPSAPEAPPEVPANESITLSHDGRTEGELCPGAASVERCAATAQAQGTPFELPVVERPTLLTFAITLDEPTHAAGCGWAVLRILEEGEWRSLGEEGRIVLGGSPLQASWSLREYPAASSFHVAVFCGSDRHHGPLHLYSGWSAPFRAEGVLHHEA